MSIILFSRPIHSGKTTELLQWCDQQKSVGGILMPDINGSRRILDISTRDIFDIECADPGNTKEPLTTIGKYHFYTNAFEKANSILLNALEADALWLIIDEAGKLELDGKGFHDALEKMIPFYDDPKKREKLVITVRDSLCEEVTRFFKIINYRLIRQVKELD